MTFNHTWFKLFFCLSLCHYIIILNWLHCKMKENLITLITPAININLLRPVNHNITFKCFYKCTKCTVLYIQYSNRGCMFVFVCLFWGGIGGGVNWVRNPTHTYIRNTKHNILSYIAVIVYLFICEFESRSWKVYSIQNYMIKFVSDLRQVCCFLWVLWFLPPIKLKYCWKWC